MTVLVIFQMIRYRDFKTFYCGFLMKYWHGCFLGLPSYPRFIELMKRAIFPLTLFTQVQGGKRTGIYYIDSSCLPVCHLKHHYQLWHTRHRSVVNAMTHLVAALAAYAIQPLTLSAIKLLAGNP